MARFRIGTQWRVHTIAGYDQHALKDESVNAGNVDFDAFIGGIGVHRRINDRWSVWASSTHYFMQRRRIVNSAMSPWANPDTGLANVSGNGLYEAYLHRSAIGVKLRWGRHLAPAPRRRR
jgi:hypothetical protein